MRSCTPGNESALSVKTVPRIRKSFTWLYFFLLGLLGVTAGNCGVPAEAGGAGSWAWPNSSLKEAKSVPITPRRLLRLSRHHHRRSGRYFLLACLLRLRHLLHPCHRR